MLGKSELEARLIAWAEEYGGGRYGNIGWSSRNLLETLAVHGGFVPDSGGFRRAEIRTSADEVEIAIREMQRGPLFRAAFVLRVDYFRPNAAMDERRRMLRAIGVCVSEAGYEAALEAGKGHLAAALGRKRAA